jgi:hypothetical protein
MVAVLLFGLNAPLYAVDGVIEINMARMAAGNITPGDTPGFPVTISEPGSYRLTGNLTPTPTVNGIEIGADNVTIDMNGFAIIGSGLIIGTNVGDGITLVSGITPLNSTVKNGVIRGMLGDGIFLTEVHVSGMYVHDNREDGIDVANSIVTGNMVSGNSRFGIRVINAIVTGNMVHDNGDVGLNLGGSSGYSNNVLFGNNSNGPQVSGGVQMGLNVCQGSTTCP